MILKCMIITHMITVKGDLHVEINRSTREQNKVK